MAVPLDLDDKFVIRRKNTTRDNYYIINIWLENDVIMRSL